MRYINAEGALQGVLELAVEAVNLDRIRPYQSKDAGRKRFRIDLGLDSSASCFLVLERDPHGSLWVFLVDMTGAEIDSWHERELAERRTLRKLWHLCRSRLYTSDTEEALADLRGFYQVKIDG